MDKQQVPRSSAHPHWPPGRHRRQAQRGSTLPTPTPQAHTPTSSSPHVASLALRRRGRAAVPRCARSAAGLRGGDIIQYCHISATRHTLAAGAAPPGGAICRQAGIICRQLSFGWHLHRRLAFVQKEGVCVIWERWCRRVELSIEMGQQQVRGLAELAAPQTASSQLSSHPHPLLHKRMHACKPSTATPRNNQAGPRTGVGRLKVDQCGHMRRHPAVVWVGRRRFEHRHGRAGAAIQPCSAGRRGSQSMVRKVSTVWALEPTHKADSFFLVSLSA